MDHLIIKTDQLTKKFGSRNAVEKVNLQVKKGEIYGFLGPNGAGKMTAIRMMLGLAKPTSGSIQIFGKNMKNERLSILRNVGSLVESPSYYGHLTARENLETIRRILNVPISRIEEVLSIVRLTKEADRPVKGFSLGMKQRLGIASALLGSPELLILDEPTNGLDPSGIQEIRELIKGLPKEQGTTVLISSHLLSEIDQMATRVGIITKGQLIFQDSIEALRRKSSSRIQVRVNDPEQAWKDMLASGIKVELNEGKLYFTNTADGAIANIVASLVHKNHAVYRVEEDTKSLEEIFLELTGGEESL